jgi:hypothetical protein
MKKTSLVPIIILLVTTGFACQDSTQKSSGAPERLGPDRTRVQTQVLVESDPADPNCSALDPHPMGESIAEKFEVPYDQVMTWYCQGSAFSDILLALETSKLAEDSVPELLSRVKTETWEEIWEDLGVSPE